MEDVPVALCLKSLLLGALVYVLVSYQRQKQRLEAEKLEKRGAMTVTQAVMRDATICGGGDQGPVLAADTPPKKPKVVVLFSSQTGTAEGFATTLGQEAGQQGFEPCVECVEDYADDDIERLGSESILVIVAATYGEGEPSDDAIQFTKWLNSEDREMDCLANVNFCVFGLGDRSYEHFCAVGHMLHDRIAELGGVPLLSLGEGDDSASIEEDFASWKRQLWPALRTHAFGADAGAAVTYSVECEGEQLTFEFPAPSSPEFTVELSSWLPETEGGQAQPKPVQASLNPLIDGKPWVIGRVQNIQELHSKRSTRSCMHVELDLKEAAAQPGSLVFTQYCAGDHVALMPENDPVIVAALSRRLNCQLAQTLSVSPVGGKAAFRQYVIPTPCTVRTALSSFVDVARPPTQALLLLLGEKATAPSERAHLLKLASVEGLATYQRTIVEEQKTLLEILGENASVAVSLGDVLEYLPRLQPRFYSISSSLRAHPQQIHVTAALVEYVKPSGGSAHQQQRVYSGICTGWLKRLSQKKGGGVGQHVKLFLRNSTFKLPRTNPRTMLATPVVLIGPGTGLAPFRAFLHERRAASDLGATHLYFGCRSEHEDYIYREELEQFLADGTLAALHVAFSRDTENKVYVQDLMRRKQDAATIWRLIDQDHASVFVCGDAKHMASAVSQAVEDVVTSAGGLDKAASVAYVAALKRTGRYLQDIW